MVSRELAEKIGGFDESFQRHQDWEFLIRVLEYTNLGYVDDVLVKKYHTGYPDYNTAVQAKKRYLQKFSSRVVKLSWEGNPVIERHRFMMAKVAFRNGKIRRGMRLLSQSTAPSIRDYFSIIISFYVGIKTQIMSTS
jgi:hypothetical protein